ncbi:tail fiber domain-containing protein [Microbulbifer sp. THAF38]|uniref:tail fiber domain-containing protein n=1 Tax=Microbulbifer sp. THAF38 TaxID=2587856 RepID=UPI001268E8DA|nr:tail fiber domain-containing protein [Microbulbifer sp. THAF38]
MSEITQKLTLEQSGVAGPSGPTGPQGATIHWGSGVPAAGLGNNGDQYLDYDNADLYGKSDNFWSRLRNLRGPQGAKGNKGDQGIQGIQGIQGEQGPGILAGNGIPIASLGRDGEHYVELNSLNKKLYRKTGGTWSVIGTLAGPKGDTGRGLSNMQVLADGTLRVSYTDGLKENAGPFPVEGLGRLVLSSINPGGGNAGYWAKVCTINMLSGISDACLMLSFVTGDQSALGSAIITVKVREGSDPDTLIGDSGVFIGSKHGEIFGDDAFKLISVGYGQPIELWVQKKQPFVSLHVYELAAALVSTKVTYNETLSWQISEPSAAYIKQSAGLVYGKNKRIYHEGQKPSPADIGAVKSGGTISVSGNSSGSASFDAEGNLSLSLTNSYANTAGSANNAISAGNADTLDGLHGWQFIRSDVDDAVNTHTWWQDGKETRWGNDADMRMMHNGSHGYLSLHTGNLYIRSGTTTKYLFDVSSGNFHADGHVYWQSSSVGSDPILKTNIRKINKPISRLKKLNGVLFDWKDTGRGSGGLMSPDIRKALPRTVYKSKLKKGGKRYDQADYNAVIGLLVEVCKDLDSRLKQQTIAFQQQEKVVKKLQRRVVSKAKH